MNAVKHQPATPLPFRFGGNDPYPGSGKPYCEIKGGNGFYDGAGPSGTGFNISGILREEDARYLVHAANSYPRLVESLRASQAVLDYRANQGDEAAAEQYRENQALLRELGEAQ